jgi:hypothetical protein
VRTIAKKVKIPSDFVTEKLIDPSRALRPLPGPHVSIRHSVHAACSYGLVIVLRPSLAFQLPLTSISFANGVRRSRRVFVGIDTAH